MPSADLRSRLAQFYSAKTVDTGLGAEVHTVTFQPLRRRSNQDRLVMHQLNIRGQEWLFLAVCDGKRPVILPIPLTDRGLCVKGHGGAATARYTASHPPSRIRAALEHLMDTDLDGRLDRKNVFEKADFISSEFGRCIRDFDRELGHVVETICPGPSNISASQARRIVWEYPDALHRACAGTTLAAAVVNLRHRFLWTMNVGDSTVGQCAACLVPLWRRETEPASSVVHRR